ncbi:hypothetical protein JW935_21640 [candidate division KSB1 bacterium]|nr:hypothetical protein [candidate division KSB1 bacterium]
MINDIKWFTDEKAVAHGGIGPRHSFIQCRASSLATKYGHVDPVMLMGASGFAFRIWIHEAFCPSAMSVFDFVESKTFSYITPL